MRGMERRQWLKLLLAASGTHVFPACNPPRAAIKANARIIVIGAGIAGLAAARELHHAGHEVIVLEARDRIGGRVYTDRSRPDEPVDLGAAWIHGTEGNPITQLAAHCGAQTISTNSSSWWTWDTNGKMLATKDEVALWDAFDELLEKLRALRNQRMAMQMDDISIAEAVDEVLEGQGLTQKQRRRLRFAMNASIEQEYAADVADLSLYHWDSGLWFDGPNVLFPEGYDCITTLLASQLDIRTGHEVLQIHEDDVGMKVITNQGIFESDYAVVTLPLGVLKAGAVHFDPPLPTTKQGAIDRLGMGVLDKVVLRFPYAFWSDADVLYLGYIAQKTGEWSTNLSFYEIDGRPTLICFHAASYAREIEDMSDEGILAAAMKVLRTMFHRHIPDPESWLITRWACDPYALGSYSYLPSGASPDDYDELARPVGRLYFAGEATNKEYSSTVHGAYLSGVRAAQEVMAQVVSAQPMSDALGEDIAGA